MLDLLSRTAVGSDCPEPRRYCPSTDPELEVKHRAAAAKSGAELNEGGGGATLEVEKRGVLASVSSPATLLARTRDTEK